jgi:hypothetical protein
VTEDEVREVVAEITTDPDAEREYEFRHPDCVIDIPQSAERFDRDGMREMQRNFPGGPPEMRLGRRVSGALLGKGTSGLPSWSRTMETSAVESSMSA